MNRCNQGTPRDPVLQYGIYLWNDELYLGTSHVRTFPTRLKIADFSYPAKLINGGRYSVQ
jgi:hypothetical protein